ncbi:hypothetical protein GO013_11900 [Pseudodesulfovibrio sp. JC047]|uniref:hypothetical protein n=1 Tax=Pseudodesulfovibrio sp. JC047 TaxID=2683199 RepID=UPI0013D84BA2|nr:hypothetical protein [Pseudodesulfovibrio sp. JC047]NDV20117.1 hypothetical protein [Pseudodesulfovibrio sp. JC047]
MKYIMFKDFSNTAVPVIFPNRIKFDEMREQMPYTTVISAGYVSHGPTGFACHGKSKGLNVVARQEDGAIITARFEDAES